MRILAIGLGALVWGAGVFLLALHVHFPDEALLQRLQFELQDRTKGAWALQASDVDPWMLTGLSFDDAVLFSVDSPRPTPKRRKKGKAAEEEEGPEEKPLQGTPWLRADTLRARVGLLSLLRRDTEVIFDADAYGGNLSGTVVQGEKRQVLRVVGEDLMLSAIPLDGDDWSFDLEGMAQLDVDMEVNKEQIRESAGHFKLALEDLKMKSGKLMGMDVGAATFTESTLEMEVKGGKAEISRGQFTSDLFEATLSGDTTLSNREVGKWRIRIQMQLKFSEELDRFAKMAPMLRNSRDEDGVYHLLCTGTVENPRCREDRSASGVRTTSAAGDRAGRSALGDKAPFGGPDDEELAASGPGSLSGLDREATGELSPEERRQKRLERIRERRERLRKQREERESSRAGALDEDGPPRPSRNNIDREMPEEFDPPNDPEPLDPEEGPPMDEGPMDLPPEEEE
jgi:type II secretion system protein N